MKNLLKTLPILLLFVTFSAFNTNEKISETKPNGLKIEIIFNSNLQPDDLISIKKKLASNGIPLTYKSFDFNENNELIAISYDVDCNDGFKGGGEKKNITSKTKWGFFRDYAEDAESPFGIDTLK
ncbi:hypothetical protein JM80_1183 [Cellulophaga sp. RHA_52]|uniref:hypothetical protein n=1 Tax=Cellulophaga sp. RHA_52 TaxID=1250036 RepID=UPI00119C2CBE|nr:hypothetical protein [Cellulophaga sp. RHA_52]TVZ08683.1 hypothetical protein JM80_1183 [Cellulophaga sp. RHA_52]